MDNIDLDPRLWDELAQAFTRRTDSSDDAAYFKGMVRACAIITGQPDNEIIDAAQMFTTITSAPDRDLRRLSSWQSAPLRSQYGPAESDGPPSNDDA